MSKTPCPTPAEIIAHIRGNTSIAVESHLSECESCLKLFDRLYNEEHGTMMEKMRHGGPPPLPFESDGPMPEQIGVYKIIRKVGSGGMGVVYEAIHTELDRRVAVKVVRSADSHFLDRFQREKKIAGLFRHPNIVEATDAGMFDGKPYLVSEFLDGNDLQHLVNEKGRMPWQRAVGLITQAAKGLDHLHQKGVIHRDIKPPNLFLTEDGVIKLLDLGIARHKNQPPDVKHTMTGQVVGSPGFMAPEQYRGGEVDARSDIYSLGCTLVYLLTGKPHMEDQAGLPPELGRIIASMTAGMPDQRFQSAAELVTALESLSKTGPISKKMLMIAGIVAAVLLFGFLLLRGCSGKSGDVSDSPPLSEQRIVENVKASLKQDEERDREKTRQEYYNSSQSKTDQKAVEEYNRDKARYDREYAEYRKAMDAWKKTGEGDPPMPPDPPDPPAAAGIP